MERLAPGVAAVGRRRRGLGGAARGASQPQPGAADAAGHGAAEEGRDGAG